MENLWEGMRELEDLQKQKEKIFDKIHEKEKEIIEKYHPLQLGDIVEVNGYAYEGKKFQVNYRDIRHDFLTKYKWYAKGAIIKKDGTLGLNRGEWIKRID